MKEGIGIGIVGCGQIMPATAARILNSESCRIVCVYDIDEKAALEEAEKLRVPVQKTLWDLLNNPEVDVVYVAVPHALHAPIGVEAARAGKHVIVEKPLASTYEDALFLAEECRKNGVLLSAHMPFCLSSAAALTKKLIADGVIGNVVSTSILSVGCKGDEYWERGVRGAGRRSYWRAFRSMAGGGILIMNAVHNIDQMLYMTGLKPVQVMSMGGTYASRAAVEDSISVLVRYDKNGAYGVCEAKSAAFGSSHTDNSTVIYGSKGTLRHGERGELNIFTTAENCGYETGKWLTIPPDGKKRNFFDDFAEAIRGNKLPEVGVPQLLNVVDLITTAYRSMQSGKAEYVNGRHEGSATK